MVLPRWLCEEGRSQICGLPWLQEARSSTVGGVDRGL